MHITHVRRVLSTNCLTSSTLVRKRAPAVPKTATISAKTSGDDSLRPAAQVWHTNLHMLNSLLHVQEVFGMI